MIRVRHKSPPTKTKRTDILTCAVTKTFPAERVRQVMAGCHDLFGENRVQEAVAKISEVGPGARWHLLGHLQRNKAGKAAALFDVVQSVDSMRLARALAERAQRPLKVYLEVNIGGEESKSGIGPGEAKRLLEDLSGLEMLRTEGLMAMEPYFEDPERARPYFRRLKELFDELQGLRLPNVEMKVLSMGMSNSYRVALEEGANMVRVGTAIFGPRPAT